MSNPLILLDTSAVFASLDVDDPNYFAARAFFRRSKGSFLVADTVFSEALTLIKQRLGVKKAIEMGVAFHGGEPFAFYRLTDEDAELTWRIFTRYTDKEWSSVDCSLLALSRRLGIEQVFAFDHHFDQMAQLGLERVP